MQRDIRVSYYALAVAMGAAGTHGTAPAAAREPTITTSASPGFEGLDEVYSTIYDVYYLDEYIGSYFGTLSGTVFSFENPDAVVSGFDETVKKDKLKELFSEILSANGRLVCRPGEARNCGALPAGQSGIVVDANRFRVDVSLSREYIDTTAEPIRYLGDPVSEPSFIQNIAFAGSLAQNGETSDRLSASLNSIASVGRTSLQVQTRLDNTIGTRVDELRVQRIEDTWKASAGLLRAQGSGVVRNYDFYGVEVTNDSGTRLGRDGGEERLPVDIVLPRPATVEIYKDGSLVSAQNYDAGLQYLDTSALPPGSYPIQVVARAGGQVILRETKTFSRTNNLPGRDETLWAIRVGKRAEEELGFLVEEDDKVDVLPEAAESYTAEVRVTRRLSESFSLSGAVTYVDENLIPEVGADWYAGLNQLSILGAVGANGGHSVIGTYSRPVGEGGFSVSFLSARRADDETPETTGDETPNFDPFFRNEDQINASVYAPLMGGSLSLLGSYSTSPDDVDDRYRFGVRYSRPLELFDNVDTNLNVEGTASDQEDRVGVRLTFSRKTSRASRLSGSIGVEHRRTATRPWETAPTADLDYTRYGRLGSSIDYSGAAGLSTNSFENRAYLGGSVVSDLGAIDATYVLAQQDQSDEVSNQLSFNGHTGFAFSSETFNFGMREPGDAMIIARVEEPDTVRSATGPQKEPDLEELLGSRDQPRHEPEGGGYRLIVDNQEYGYVDGTGSSAVGVTSLRQYSVTLDPVDAPQFDIDLTPRTVPLYPGNIAVIEWEATEVATLFGRVLTPDRTALAFARLQSDSDMTVTDDRGYFTLTSSRDEEIEVYTANGETCHVPEAGLLVDFSQSEIFHRVGDIVCK
ncbi:MAG: TcfC E-set like domain-containing protein [Henriciella sp.]|uniref:TcfC E-set like domain-containing protein n=1 Tax=Henriciella sp. TaxID=1968823 RepID=UPI0032EF51EE